MSEPIDTPSLPCPQWIRGYCVADLGCKLRHASGEGGQLQESYLSQLKQQQGSNVPPEPSSSTRHGAAMAASALYGGTDPFGRVPYSSPTYGYAVPIGAPMGAPLGALVESEPPRNYKTIQCRHFLRGHCARGATCGFRHEGEPQAENTERPFRVVKCKRWLSGHCALEERCTYKHEAPYGQPATSYAQAAPYYAPYGAPYAGRAQFAPPAYGQTPYGSQPAYSYGAAYAQPVYARGYGGPSDGPNKRSLSPEKTDNSNESFKLQKTVE